eukprot:scaffold69841_cov14-Tisochrysis_lutea.AAC.2
MQQKQIVEQRCIWHASVQSGAHLPPQAQNSLPPVHLFAAAVPSATCLLSALIPRVGQFLYFNSSTPYISHFSQQSSWCGIHAWSWLAQLLTDPCCLPVCTHHVLQIHWFSIINSCVTVLLLTGFLATILMRVLKADFIKYSRDDRKCTFWFCAKAADFIKYSRDVHACEALAKKVRHSMVGVGVKLDLTMCNEVNE